MVIRVSFLFELCLATIGVCVFRCVASVTHFFIYTDFLRKSKDDIMGLFDKLNSLLGATVDKQPQNIQTVDRRNIAPDQIDDMQKIPASKGYRDKIYRKYYSSYPVKPFISLDRERNSNWLEQAEIFPKQAIIPVSMMTPFNDGLLPGHIYLLYWDNPDNRQLF